MQKTVIEAKHLVKKYDDFKAVDGINLDVYKGECFGLLGPNGAGKSTLMRMMYCNSLVSDGELFVLGLNVKKNYREIKARIGVVPQENGLDEDFNVIQNLYRYASYQGIDDNTAKKRVAEILRIVRLEDSQEKEIRALSGGMKRRLAIGRALINYPELLFLDEPSTGLDPQARLWIWDFLKKTKSENGTIVLTTHYMEEAEIMCDRVAIVDNGRILTIGKPADLIQEHIGVEVVEFEATNVDLNYYLGRLKDKQYRYQVFKNVVSIHIQEGQDGRRAMDLFASNRITVRKPTLSDVFLKLSGHELRDVVYGS